MTFQWWLRWSVNCSGSLVVHANVRSALWLYTCNYYYTGISSWPRTASLLSYRSPIIRGLSIRILLFGLGISLSHGWTNFFLHFHVLGCWYRSKDETMASLLLYGSPSDCQRRRGLGCLSPMRYSSVYSLDSRIAKRDASLLLGSGCSDLLRIFPRIFQHTHGSFPDRPSRSGSLAYKDVDESKTGIGFSSLPECPVSRHISLVIYMVN